jgi:hypothetical protein
MELILQWDKIDKKPNIYMVITMIISITIALEDMLCDK